MLFFDLLLLLCPCRFAFADVKIRLTDANVIDGFGAPQGGGYEKDVPYNLLDEQDFVGDPRSAGKSAAIPKTMWAPGFSRWYYPHVFVLVDLQATYQLSSVWAFHQFVHTDTWVYNGSHPTSHWDNKWLGFNTTATGRYIALRMIEPTSVHELVVYGTRIKPQAEAKAKAQAQAQAAEARAVVRRPALMRSLIGVNGFVDDPVERLRCAGAVREYQDWSWTEGAGDPGYPHARNKFSPAYSSFDIDAFYNATRAAGLDVHECLQGRAAFLVPAGNATMAKWKPAPNALVEAGGTQAGWRALEQPSAYAAVAAHAFQTAARYGANVAVGDALLQLAPGQARRRGLGTLGGGVEVMNEPNGWWNDGARGFMSPYQIAAMMSAAYDGHEGALGPGVGVKAADPAMRVVMSGITGTGRRNQDSVRMMRLWAQHHRKDGKFPADAINYHGYFGGGDSEQVSSDLPPEAARMQEALANLTRWRDANLPAVEVWLTEFGWDTNQASPNRAKAYGPYDGEQVQAMWLARGLLAASAGRLDRAHVYMLRDVNDRGTGKFTTCGLTSSKQTGHVPKLSWYYVATLTALLGEMAMVAPPLPDTTPPGTPLVAKFAPPAAGAADAADTADTADAAGAAGGAAGIAATATAAYALWLPSDSNAKVADFALELSGVGAALAADTPVTLVQLVMNSTNGNQSSLHLELAAAPQPGSRSGSGSAAAPPVVRIPLVTEVPVLVLVGVKPSPPTGPVPPITPPVYWQCKGRPMGLYCDANSSASAYVVCPQGQREACPDGQRCVQREAAGAGTGARAEAATSPPGQISCVDAPSPCQDRPAGLYCTPARPKPSPTWPDGYVVCPETLPLWCPTETPHCTQLDNITGSAVCR